MTYLGSSQISIIEQVAKLVHNFECDYNIVD